MTHFIRIQQYRIKVRRNLLALIWFSATCLPSVSLAQPGLDAAARQKLKAGEILVEVIADPQGTEALINAVLDIAASPSQLWAVMLDCESSKRTIASLKSCRIVDKSPDESCDVREHVIQWIWPLPSVRSRFRSCYQPFQSIKFHRTEGDLAVLIGEWRLEPLNQGHATRLFYQSRISLGWPVPSSLVRAALNADIPKTLSALRREATGHE